MATSKVFCQKHKLFNCKLCRVAVVGEYDRNGKKIIQVADGWYKTADGCLYDPDGYQWYADTSGTVPEQRVGDDSVSGEKMIVRDFKFATNPLLPCDPKEFYEHYKKTIEQTMVETGWEYDEDRKGAPAVVMGEDDEHFVHIRVRMKKKAWKNRDNAYAGARQGETGTFKSKALSEAGARDPHIYGAVETDRAAAEILSNKK
jgi:hypothetical protein